MGLLPAECLWGWPQRGLRAGGTPTAPHSFPYPPAAGAGWEDKCRKGRAEILAEAPARFGAGTAANRTDSEKRKAQAGAGEEELPELLFKIFLSPDQCQHSRLPTRHYGLQALPTRHWVWCCWWLQTWGAILASGGLKHKLNITCLRPPLEFLT